MIKILLLLVNRGQNGMPSLPRGDAMRFMKGTISVFWRMTKFHSVSQEINAATASAQHHIPYFWFVLRQYLLPQLLKSVF